MAGRFKIYGHPESWPGLLIVQDATGGVEGLPPLSSAGDGELFQKAQDGH